MKRRKEGALGPFQKSGRPSTAVGSAFLCARGHPAERASGARWDVARPGERRELFVKEKRFLREGAKEALKDREEEKGKGCWDEKERD